MDTMRLEDGEWNWAADGKTVRIGYSIAGSGPRLLLLPALSSISARDEVRDLQLLLAADYETIAVDWPGFGTMERPKLHYRPQLYVAFMAAVEERFGPFAATIAAGHGAGYALRHGARHPQASGALVLLSPTWRGPLPTMTRRRLPLFAAIARAGDVPVLGAALYRANINGPVIGLMTRGHVYENPEFVSAALLASKRRVTEASGARYASLRFVTGELDPYASGDEFRADGKAVTRPLLVLYADRTPRKSKAEMQALAAVQGVDSRIMPRGKLSFYEEFPIETAEAVRSWLAVTFDR